MITKQTLSYALAEKVIGWAVDKAEEMGVPQNIAVVDDAGHLVAFCRMDGAKFFSIEIAMTKAYAAAGLRASTHEVAPKTQPGMPGYGAQALNGGRFTTLGGGVPLSVDGRTVGAIGVSSGTVEQDTEVAQYAANTFQEYVN
ncbi:ATP:cob(I)alamin adenosyltransferase [Microvirga guangxiensis]|uniref:ATP:cob(I)alamin adenosyltransferase n=2 Tax=Microvirga guangxiensis TaxID=549386 RepID=A0A1G5KMS8_9HYPH|nr:ATP:cob(I)alamin adenosyltransferase [Microvirga guangxiensis]